MMAKVRELLEQAIKVEMTRADEHVRYLRYDQAEPHIKRAQEILATLKHADPTPPAQGGAE